MCHSLDEASRLKGQLSHDNASEIGMKGSHNNDHEDSHEHSRAGFHLLKLRIVVLQKLFIGSKLLLGSLHLLGVGEEGTLLLLIQLFLGVLDLSYYSLVLVFAVHHIVRVDLR